MIEALNITKKYGSFLAVDNLSLKVEPGEILGFLGPNGAGKSTTMRMLTGFLKPTSGKVLIGGVDIDEKPIQAKKNIGYLPESSPSYKDMTTREFMNFAAGARGIPSKDINDRVDKIISDIFLGSVADKLIENLSKGYKQRVCLGQALIHDPKVLVMDEPTDGLDPNQKAEVRKLIRNLSAGKAIILSTHILEEMESVCNRVLIINKGKIVEESTPEKLLALSPNYNSVTVTFTKREDFDSFYDFANRYKTADKQDLTIRVYKPDRSSILEEINSFFEERKIIPLSIVPFRVKPEEVFHTLTN